jgi:RHS repeat-associated protein
MIKPAIAAIQNKVPVQTKWNKRSATMKLIKHGHRSLLTALKALIVGLCIVTHVAAQTSTVTYFHNDLAGSPVAASDSSGTIIWRESYRPYGERLTNASASQDNSQWYTGHRQDAESGLVYMGARHYDPLIGRFLSIDPAPFTEGNPHSFNRYAYANNNPVKFVDPDGKFAIPLWVGALLVGGAIVVSMSADTRMRLARDIKAAFNSNRNISISPVPTTVYSDSTAGDSDQGGASTDKEKPKKIKDVPDKGPPGEWIDGKRRSRKYGADGQPELDIDKPHQGYEKPHIHEWHDGKREEPGRDVSPVEFPKKETG